MTDDKKKILAIAAIVALVVILLLLLFFRKNVSSVLNKLFPQISVAGLPPLNLQTTPVTAPDLSSYMPVGSCGCGCSDPVKQVASHYEEKVITVYQSLPFYPKQAYSPPAPAYPAAQLMAPARNCEPLPSNWVTLSNQGALDWSRYCH